MAGRYTRDGAERARLRGELHGEPPVLQVGREGISPAVLAAVEEALAAREVIKVRFGKGCPVDAGEGGRRLADRLAAELLGTIGRVALLYRPAEEERSEPHQE